MSISPRFLEEMKNRLTLSDIIGRRVKVTRAGREFKACCPFHHEKSPSFTINDDKQFYHCFGCGAHGDVIGFVMQHDNLDFMHAVEMLASEAGMQMPKPDPRAVEQAKKSKSLYNVMDDAARWMQDQLAKPEHKDVRDYLDQRGISPQSRDIFRIGYAPGDGQALRRFLKGKDYTDAMMIEAGLLKPSTKGGEPYIFFRDRIMVPVTDRRGQVVAFGGRILPEHIRPQKGDFKPPKYINTADTPLFDKGRMLFAESQARHAAREGHSIIVTEGYMDVIACHQAGFKGAVAPMGTALTEDQAVLLWSMIPSDEKLPTLCFDGDNAGRSAASRACERILPLLQPGQSVQFAFLPDGEDPDSLLKSGGAGALKSVLHAAMPLFDFLWLSRVAGRNLESPEMRAGLEKSLHNEIAKIKDADVQRYYRGLLRDKISQTFYPRPQSGKPQNRDKIKKPNIPALRLKKPQGQNQHVKDKILLTALINHPQIYTQIEDAFGEFTPAWPRLNDMRQDLILLCEENPDIDTAAIRNHFIQKGFEQEMDDILNESVYVHAAFCRPPRQNDGESYNDVAAQWNAFWAGLKAGGMDREIKQGWRQAYDDSNEEEEEKLRRIVAGHKAESDD